MVHTGPPQTRIPRHLEQPPLPVTPTLARMHRPPYMGTPWAESHIPILVHFHGHCNTVLGFGLIMDTYGEGDAKSLAPAGMERGKQGRRGKEKVSFREFGMPQARWVLLI